MQAEYDNFAAPSSQIKLNVPKQERLRKKVIGKPETRWVKIRVKNESTGRSNQLL